MAGSGRAATGGIDSPGTRTSRRITGWVQQVVGAASLGTSITGAVPAMLAASGLNLSLPIRYQDRKSLLSTAKSANIHLRTLTPRRSDPPCPGQSKLLLPRMQPVFESIGCGPESQLMPGDLARGEGCHFCSLRAWRPVVVLGRRLEYDSDAAPAWPRVDAQQSIDAHLQACFFACLPDRASFQGLACLEIPTRIGPLSTAGIYCPPDQNDTLRDHRQCGHNH